MEYLGERISVVASFGLRERLRPVKFMWSERVVQVKDVTYRWTEMEGQAKVYHFSVTDGSTLYELSFNASAIGWKLERVETDV
ncbi:MAG: hypothetical protein HQL01_03665 [Nitrospirae bacterium]|nr:hypothetical protein [Nitrospirota bacterium]